ncbi:MAG TPA: hypothetical protein VFX60_05860 [Micromonospora sp.]|nr:hypothetical protein [Micromonospora sp.]
MVALVATGAWNPFPDLWTWANRSKPLSEPDVVWQQRLGGGTPQNVTIAGKAVIVRHRTSVEARNLSSGVRLWRRKADWAAVAGGTQDPVVAVGKLLVKGYEVIDPQTGAVRRRDDSAVAVWTYRNALLDARCFEPDACTLTAWEPRGSTPLWSVDLPGIATSLFADNPEVLGTRPLTVERVAADAGGPEQMPTLIGFPIDGRVYVVNTATGQLVRELKPDRQERIVVVGGRVLRIRSIAEDGTCYFTVRGHDPANNQPVWQRDGFNLRTADRAGCAQRHNPQGSQNVIVGVAPDRRESVLGAYDGRRLWTGDPGEKLLAVDDRYALVRAANGKSIKAHELAVTAPRWTRKTRPESQAALARHAGLVLDEKPDRIVAVDPRTGRELVTLRSSAKVLAVGPDGMIIGHGRDIGYVRFGGSDGAPESRGPGDGAPGAGPGSSTGPGATPTCGGPKREQCGPPVDGK